MLAVVILSIVLLLGVLTASGCDLSGITNSTSRQAEEAFRVAVRGPIDPQVRLLTEKNRYRHADWIGIWVENGTGHVLEFKDQTLGFRAYRYDEQNRTWRLAVESIVAADPYQVTATPGPRSALPIVSIPVEWIKGTGAIRLVITGITDQGQPFAAYKDIEIVD
jgi:hypothetical protein